VQTRGVQTQSLQIASLIANDFGQTRNRFKRFGPSKGNGWFLISKKDEIIGTAEVEFGKKRAECLTINSLAELENQKTQWRIELQNKKVRNFG
jgi:hypothetical protein